MIDELKTMNVQLGRIAHFGSIADTRLSQVIAVLDDIRSKDNERIIGAILKILETLVPHHSWDEDAKERYGYIDQQTSAVCYYVRKISQKTDALEDKLDHLMALTSSSQGPSESTDA